MYIHVRGFLKTPPAALRGHRRLVDDDTLQGIADRTASNAITLERLEKTITANSIDPVVPPGLLASLWMPR